MNDLLLSAVLPYVVRSTIVLGLAFAVTRALARRSAAARHRVWVLAIAAVALLPAVSSIVPVWHILPAFGEAVTHAEPRNVATPRLDEMPAPSPPVVSAAPVASSAVPSERGVAPESALLALWALGAAAVLARAASAIAARARLFRRARVAGDDPADRAWQCAAAAAAAELGRRRPVELRWSDDIAVPVTWGVARPVVVLPQGSRSWTADRARAVMLHELAHAARGDAAVQLAARLVLALHWFNPLAWRALARLQAEAEHAADDRVLTAGFGAVPYADHLVSVARALRPGFAPPAAGVAMARLHPPSALERRIRAILAPGRPRLAPGLVASLSSSLLALLVLVPLGAAGCSRAGVHSSFEYASDGAPIGYFAQPRFEGQCAGGIFSSHRRSTKSVVRNDGAREVRLEQGSCRLDITLDKGVLLGETSIERLEPGASFVAVETSGAGKRELRARLTDNAPLTFDFRVDGKEQPFEGAGAAFLAATVQELHRSTEIGAEERIARLYAAGGLDAVLGEIGKISNTWVRQVYVSKLLGSSKLTTADRVRVLGALRQFELSDYELATVLKEAVGAWPPQLALPAEFFDAEAGIEADYERGQLLQKVLRERSPIESDRLAVLHAVAAGGSDYERGQVLLAAIERQAPSAAEWPVLLDSAGKLGSDYEHGQVLRRLIASRTMSEPEATAVLNDIARLGSDYERAELLTALAKRHAVTGPVVETYVAVAKNLGSEYEQNRALAALHR